MVDTAETTKWITCECSAGDEHVLPIVLKKPRHKKHAPDFCLYIYIDGIGIFYMRLPKTNSKDPHSQDWKAWARVGQRNHGVCPSGQASAEQFSSFWAGHADIRAF